MRWLVDRTAFSYPELAYSPVRQLPSQAVDDAAGLVLAQAEAFGGVAHGLHAAVAGQVGQVVLQHVEVAAGVGAHQAAGHEPLEGGLADVEVLLDEGHSDRISLKPPPGSPKRRRGWEAW